MDGAGQVVVVLHAMDAAEREFQSAGEANFTDPESLLSVPASSADVRTAYGDTVTEVIAEWRQALSAMGASYELVVTDQPYAVPLRRALDARQRPWASSLPFTCCWARLPQFRCCWPCCASALQPVW